MTNEQMNISQVTEDNKSVTSTDKPKSKRKVKTLQDYYDEKAKLDEREEKETVKARKRMLQRKKVEDEINALENKEIHELKNEKLRAEKEIIQLQRKVENLTGKNGDVSH